MGLAQAAAAPLGLLGGSFDPIHNGHLQLARDALEQLRLSEVHFIPAAQPWQKSRMTAAEHRAQMVQLALAGEARFVLDMREIARGGITYTIDTLRHLREALPERPLVLIMGSDQFGTWTHGKAGTRLLRLPISRSRSARALCRARPPNCRLFLQGAEVKSRGSRHGPAAAWSSS